MSIASRVFKGGLCVLALLFVAIQCWPVDRSNPPVTGDVAAPAPVGAILRASCYDCHSNETVWPWYSRIAPVSWLVARDVAKGRAELNFSTWAQSPAEEQAEARGEIAEAVAEGEMPLAIYLLTHPGARLDAAKRDALLAWAGHGAGSGGSNGDDEDD